MRTNFSKYLTLELSLIVFVPTLLFTIAYNLTKLNVKSIIYVLLMSIVLTITNLVFINYTFPSAYSNYNLRFLIPYINLLYNNFLIIPIFMGTSYLFAKYYKLSITPLDKKSIALLYTGLFIPLFIPVIKYNLYPSFPYYIYIITLYFTLTYLIYYYFWTATFLRRSNNLSNYPYKMIFSYIVAITLAITFSIIIVYALQFIYSFIRANHDSLIMNIIISSIFAYILGILLFFILLTRSKSLIYRGIHWATYAMITIILIGIMSKILSSQVNTMSLIEIIAIVIGYTLFFISLSLYILYLSNKIAINLCFKNTNTQNINEI